jgi:hypothetical protein
LLNLLCIQISLRNLLPALLEYTKNWFVGKTLQQIGDDDKADYLSKEQLRIPSKGLGGIAHRIHYAAAGCEE